MAETPAKLDLNLAMQMLAADGKNGTK